MRQTMYRFGAPGGASMPRATVAILALSGAMYVLSWFGLRDRIVPWLSFDGDLSKPWTLITYPLAQIGAGSDLLWFLFSLYWLYIIGSYLEPELGEYGFGGAFFGSALAGSISLLVGGLLVGLPQPLLGLGLPLAAVTCLWGARYAETEIRLWGIIPIKGKWIAVFTALITLFGYGAGAPILGLFALVPLALMAAWGLGRLPIPYGRIDANVKADRAQKRKEKQEFDSFIGNVREREKEREERERLRKLFEESSQDDSER